MYLLDVYMSLFIIVSLFLTLFHPIYQYDLYNSNHLQNNDGDKNAKGPLIKTKA